MQPLGEHDTNPGIHPNRLEACDNGVDDDCDGFIDAADTEACGPLAITPAAFEATATDEGVLLTSTTIAEVDVAGFRILFSGSGPGSERLWVITPHVIPAAGSALEGATYRYVHALRQNAGTARYYLEAVDLTGEVEHFGPVEIDLTPARVRDAWEGR